MKVIVGLGFGNVGKRSSHVYDKGCQSLCNLTWRSSEVLS